MEYKDFEAFKQEIKAWLDTHQDEYIAFQNNINGKSLDDFFLLYSKIAPNFQNKVNSIFYADIVPSFNDSSPIKLDDDEVSAIKEAFSNLNESSVVTSIFAWIFFGKFFEKMVEVHINLLEQLYKPESLIEKVKKWLIGRFVGNTADPINVDDYEIRVECTIKELVAKSIELHFRTKQDWLHYIGKNSFDNKRSRVIANNAIEDALSSLPEDNACAIEIPLGSVNSPEQTSNVDVNNTLSAESAISPIENDTSKHCSSEEVHEHNDEHVPFDSESSKEKLEDYLKCENPKKKKKLLNEIRGKLRSKDKGPHLAVLYVVLLKLGYLDIKEIKYKKTFHDLLVNQYKDFTFCGVTNFQNSVKIYFGDSFELKKRGTKYHDYFSDLMNSLANIMPSKDSNTKND